LLIGFGYVVDHRLWCSYWRLLCFYRYCSQIHEHWHHLKYHRRGNRR